MSILTKAQNTQLKGRLAGFFLWRQSVAIVLSLVMLCACEQPAKTVPGELAFQQAKQAQAQGLSSKAMELYQQSAQLGYLPAVAARLAMQQPTDSSVALRAWLANLPEALQPSLLHSYQQLGSKLDPIVTASPDITPARHCAITVQPLVSTELEHSRWLNLADSWQQDDFLSSLQICFLPVLKIDVDIIKCSDQPERRLHCDLPALQSQVKVGQFNQLLILSGRGSANFNNGVLLLPTYADLKLLKHEFSHILGFLDEYALSENVAKSECMPGRITPNILFSKADLAKYLRHWQLPEDAVKLTEVATCQHAGRQAYRVVPDVSHLQHYEMMVPELYQSLMHKQLSRATEIMPVQYYFAYLARQEGDWPLWLAQMERAAAFGYPAAQAALAEWHSRQAASSTAR